MKLLAFDPQRWREIDAFDSEGFAIAPLARVAGAGQIALVRLAPGGRIGRHEAACAQLLALVSGSATVTGGDGVPHLIAAGAAAFWSEGEEHETSTEDGLVAVVIEAGEVEP